MLIDGSPLEASAAPLGDLSRVGVDTRPGELGLVSAIRSRTWRELEEESERLPPARQPGPPEPAPIFFASGSAGPAKSVTHTRSSLRWMIASAAAAFELSAEDVSSPAPRCPKLAPSSGR